MYIHYILKHIHYIHVYRPYPDHILTISWPYPVYSNISDAYPDHILSIFCAYSVQHILAISAIFAPYLCPYSEHVGDVGDVGHVLQIMVDRAVDANRTLFTEWFRLQAVSCVQAVWWGVQEMWYRLEELLCTNIPWMPRTSEMADFPFLVEIAISWWSRLKSRKKAMAGCERALHELSMDTKNAQNGWLSIFGRDCDLPMIQIEIS